MHESLSLCLPSCQSEVNMLTVVSLPTNVLPKLNTNLRKINTTFCCLPSWTRFRELAYKSKYSWTSMCDYLSEVTSFRIFQFKTHTVDHSRMPRFSCQRLGKKLNYLLIQREFIAYNFCLPVLLCSLSCTMLTANVEIRAIRLREQSLCQQLVAYKKIKQWKIVKPSS